MIDAGCIRRGRRRRLIALGLGVGLTLAAAREAHAAAAIWKNLPSAGLRSRSFHCAAYFGDENDGKVVVFGGRVGSQPLDETWVFETATNSWVPQSGPNPPARFGCAMAYDPNPTGNGAIVMHGGTDGAQVLQDTWEWNGAWTFRNDGPPQDAHVMAYDPSLQRVVSFAGRGPSGVINPPQLFAWDRAAGTWSTLASGPLPAARQRAAMVYQTQQARLVLYGGVSGFTFRDDAHTLAGGTWSTLCPNCTGSGRAQHAMADGANTTQGVILFGGASTVLGVTSYIDLTWNVIGNTWNKLCEVAPPAPRGGHALVYHQQRRRFLLIGGSDASGDRPNNDVTWEMHVQGQSCANDAQCPSQVPGVPGHCVDGVCCDTPCDQDCHSCNQQKPPCESIDGVCRPTTTTAPEDCNAGIRQCKGKCDPAGSGMCQFVGPTVLCNDTDPCWACDDDSPQCNMLPANQDDPQCPIAGKCSLANTSCRTYKDPPNVMHRCLDKGDCGWRWSDCIDISNQAPDGSKLCFKDAPCEQGFCKDVPQRMQPKSGCAGCGGGGCGGGGCGGGCPGHLTDVTVILGNDFDRSKLLAVYHKTTGGEAWDGFTPINIMPGFPLANQYDFDYCSIAGPGTPVTFTHTALDTNKNLLALGQADTVIGQAVTIHVNGTIP